MSGSPQETWRKLQRSFANAQRKGGQSFPGPNPRNVFGGAAGLLLLGGGAIFVSNALFNGTYSLMAVSGRS